MLGPLARVDISPTQQAWFDPLVLESHNHPPRNHLEPGRRSRTGKLLPGPARSYSEVLCTCLPAAESYNQRQRPVNANELESDLLFPFRIRTAQWLRKYPCKQAVYPAESYYGMPAVALWQQDC